MMCIAPPNTSRPCANSVCVSRWTISVPASPHSLYLQELPIHTIKIDRSFTTQIGKSERSELIAELIVAMSKLLKLNSVAEGVETQAQADIARHWGCNIAQGFLYAPALPADDFLTWLAEREHSPLQ